MNLFKRKPKEETVATITLADHRTALDAKDETIRTLRQEVSGLRADVRAVEMAYDCSHDSYRRVARELAELKAKDERRKAQARSNLKQNRQARDKQQAGEVV